MGFLIALVALCLIVAGPVVSLVAIGRLRELERRVAGLEARRDAATDRPPPAAAEVATPLTAASAAAASAGLDSGDEAADLSAPADADPTVPAAKPDVDWEAAVAGRWLNRIGLLAVAVGVSYFLKLAIDSAWIGPRGQVVTGMVAGLGLVAWSGVLGGRLRYFADGIAGLGGSILYLSIWAAGLYYQLISSGLTFVSMAAVSVAMTGLALSRSSPALAALALVGGFLAPALVSTGNDAQVVLLLYLAAQNTILLVLARQRDWRFLEAPAFVFTQLYFWNWFDRFYTDAVLIRTLAFAVLFFVQFSALPVIRVRLMGVLRVEQALLVVANAAFILAACHALLWPDGRWWLTVAVLALSACHLGLARAVPPTQTGESTARVLFAGLALTCATLAIPIRFEGTWITVALAVEGAVLVWSGFRTRLWYLRTAAHVLFVSALLNLLATGPESAVFLFNEQFGAALVLAGTAALAAWKSGQSRDQLSPLEAIVTVGLSVGANVLMIAALSREVYHYFGPVPGGGVGATDVLLARSLTISLLWTIYATGLVLTGAQIRTAAVRWQGLALLGLATLKVFFVDLDYLSGFYRVGSSIALGIVLLAVSLLYQRKLAGRLVDGRTQGQSGPGSR